MKEPAIGIWRRTGGGCHTSAGGADLMTHPCDDDYEHTETKERIRIYSTFDQHFNMPNQVGSPEELYDLTGVVKER